LPSQLNAFEVDQKGHKGVPLGATGQGWTHNQSVVNTGVRPIEF